MAFDEAFANRIRDILSSRDGVGECKMFGGIAFMLDGNMAVGIIGEDLMVRLDPADTERAHAASLPRSRRSRGRSRGRGDLLPLCGRNSTRLTFRWRASQPDSTA